MEQLDPGFLQQVVKLLTDTRIPDTNVQRAVTQQLAQLNQNADFNKYLTFIFVTSQNDEMLRKTAGLALKNNINLNFHSMSPEVQAYIKAGLMSILGSPQAEIRRTVANNITTIASGHKCATRTEALERWPELFPSLIQALQSPDGNLMSGAFETLELLCDDLNVILDRDIGAQRPTNILIPQLLRMLQSSTQQNPPTPISAMVQQHCLSCLNHFLLCMPAVLQAEMQSYLQTIFALATSPDPVVRQHVCHAFVMLVELRPDHVFFQSGVQNVVEYMLTASKDQNGDVALEACEFWSAICRRQEEAVTKQLLAPFLPRLLPLLLSNMVFTQEELELLDMHDVDEDEEDRDEDLRPTHHRGRPTYGEESDESDGEEEADSDPVGWNIRKCAAGGLDNMAVVFGPELWPHLQPLIEQNLNSANWLEREVAVLALGAVAEGCLEGLQQHLDGLFQFLCLLLKDTQPQIRSITCWTISRFSAWLVERNDPERYIKPVLTELLARIHDTNKRVQRVACSAFATLEDEAQDILVPYLDEILTTLMTAFQRFQAKNMLILYDALATLAEAVGPALKQPQYTQTIVPAIMNKWATLDLNSKQLLPLLECLTDLCKALEEAITPYAAEAFKRCILITQQVLALNDEAMARGTQPPDLDPIIWSMDLFGALCGAVGSNCDALLASADPPLIKLMFDCLQDSAGLELTRQSVLALIGDLSRSSIGYLEPHIQHIFPLLMANLKPYFVAICNNASWAIGEVSVRIEPNQLAPFAPGIAQKLVEIILNPHQEFNLSLLENCAITLGRLGMVMPSAVAPGLEQVLPAWCVQIKLIHDLTEKGHAYMGLVNVIQANPNAALQPFPIVCDCLASCNIPDQQLHTSVHQLLHGFKVNLGDQFPALMEGLPPKLRQVMQSRYHL